VGQSGYSGSCRRRLVAARRFTPARGKAGRYALFGRRPHTRCHGRFSRLQARFGCQSQRSSFRNGNSTIDGRRSLEKGLRRGEPAEIVLMQERKKPRQRGQFERQISMRRTSELIFGSPMQRLLRSHPVVRSHHHQPRPDSRFNSKGEICPPSNRDLHYQEEQSGHALTGQVTLLPMTAYLLTAHQGGRSRARSPPTQSFSIAKTGGAFARAASSPRISGMKAQPRAMLASEPFHVTGTTGNRQQEPE